MTVLTICCHSADCNHIVLHTDVVLARNATIQFCLWMHRLESVRCDCVHVNSVRVEPSDHCCSSGLELCQNECTARRQ
jgi:hypothetical protein